MENNQKTALVTGGTNGIGKESADPVEVNGKGLITIRNKNTK